MVSSLDDWASEVREFLSAAGQSHARVAELLGVERSAVTQYLSGKNPSFKTVEKVNHAVSELIGIPTIKIYLDSIVFSIFKVSRRYDEVMFDGVCEGYLRETADFFEHFRDGTEDVVFVPHINALNGPDLWFFEWMALTAQNNRRQLIRFIRGGPPEKPPLRYYLEWLCKRGCDLSEYLRKPKLLAAIEFRNEAIQEARNAACHPSLNISAHERYNLFCQLAEAILKASLAHFDLGHLEQDVVRGRERLIIRPKDQVSKI